MRKRLHSLLFWPQDLVVEAYNESIMIGKGTVMLSDFEFDPESPPIVDVNIFDEFLHHRSCPKASSGRWSARCLPRCRGLGRDRGQGGWIG